MSKKKEGSTKKGLPKHAVYSLTARDVLELQMALINTAEEQGVVVASCIRNNFRHILATFFMPGARPFTANVAQLKASQTSLTARMTEDAGNLMRTGEVGHMIFGVDPEEIIIWMGGVPIYDSEGHFLGSIAVSNLTGEEDKDLAITAIKKCGLRIEI